MILLTQFLGPIVLLLLQIRLLLYLGLVEAVDDGVLSLRNEYPFDLYVSVASASGFPPLGSHNVDEKKRKGPLTIRGSLKLTWPTSMLPSFFRLDQGV